MQYTHDHLKILIAGSKGVRKVGGVKTPLERDILQNLITCAKEINCCRIFVLVNLWT